MKKYNLLLCGLIAMLFSACTKDELTEVNSQPLGEIVSVTAYAAGSGEDTRVSYTDKGDGSYSLAWEDEESFSVIRGGDNKTFSKNTAGNTFTGVLPGGDGDYYAVYPANESTSTQVPYDLSVQKGVLDSEKTLMYASSEDGTEFQFHHSTAILKAVFSGLPAETTISRVVVTTAEANLKGYHDLVNKKLTSNSSSQQIIINFTPAVATDTPVFIYLPPMAADKKSLSFHVTTSNGVYAGSLAGTGGKDIKAGYVYNATVAVSKVESYLTFTAEKAGQKMKIWNNGTSASFSDSFWSSNTYYFQYSTDGVTWNNNNVITKNNYKQLNEAGGIAFDGTTHKLYLRGNFSKGTSDSGNDSKNLCIAFTDNDNKVTCTGDIRTLITFGDFTTVNTSNVTFKGLFKECKALTTAPELPATKLAEKCYYNMFNGCSSLTTAPAVLPATTLAANCYYNMFYNCTSLTAAPELPATTLADYCYQYMFYGCSKLATAPKLPATTLADYCYQCMFYNCSSLTTAPALPATTLAVKCYYNMFSECTLLATAPELPATTLAESCYYYMFYNCRSLATAPALPATTLAAECYKQMFDNCTSLTTVPAVLPATTLADYCYHSMFSGCTSLTKTPKLPATTLANGCYNSMFSGCSNLRTVYMLATDISAPNCLFNWLNGVPTIPAGGELTFYKNTEMMVGDGGIPQNSPSGIPSSYWRVTDYIE